MCLATPLRFIPLLPIELALATVLKSGQSFRWHRCETVVATQPDAVAGTPESARVEGEEFAMAWRDRTIVLRQDATGIYYRSLFPSAPPHTAYLADIASNTTLPLLRAYFQLDTPLEPLYADWTARDAHFKKKVEAGGARLEGIRVLAQDPWETLISFICSSNNHISRITGMVNSLCKSLGAPLPHPSSFSPSSLLPPSSLPPSAPSSLPVSTNSPALIPLYAFPRPSALTPPSTDALLRTLGCGYRSRFIMETAVLLEKNAKEAGMETDEYLDGLREGKLEGGLEEARRRLQLFMGVGRKVADCVALFGLGWKEVVPVDTHVFQIAIRDYSFPSTKSTALTPVLHNRVASLLQSRWGSHAGWAQQVLFFADLKVPKAAGTTPRKKAKDAVVVKAKWETELDALLETPVKRTRVETRETPASPAKKGRRTVEESPLRRKIKA